MTKPRHEDLVGTLERRARTTPDLPAFTFLREDGRVDATLTVAELAERATSVAARLRSSARPGDRALLLHPPGLDYVVAFYGCLIAGIVAVPLYVPPSRTIPVVDGIARDCSAAVVATTAAGIRRRPRFPAGSRDLPWIDTTTVDTPAPVPRPCHADWHDVAYLQYTSGSTSSPKGVVITHDNLLHQCAELASSWRAGPDSRIVSWLPHFHDFGQVAGVLMPVFLGCRCVLMAPGTFVKRPARWLQALTAHRATHTAAPNFAFDLCVDATTDAERAGLDLGTLVCASNGAEPVRAETVERFQRVFADHGLAPGVVCPGYGLAEATLKVTVTEPGAGLACGTFDAGDLGRGVARRVDDPGGLRLVGCGAPEPDTEIAVVDPERCERLPDGRIGELWVAGPIVSPGYWGRPDETAATFGGRIRGEGNRPFLRTGDLGFLDDGRLYVCGRITDIVIVDGVNHHPQDIERTVRTGHPALRRARVAAFGVERDGGEVVVVVAEVDRHDETPPDELATAVRSAVSDAHRLAPTVVLVEVGSVPMTTSGKVRRRDCRADHLGGRLAVRHLAESAPRRPAVPTTVDGPGARFGSAAGVLTSGLRSTVDDWLARHVLGPGIEIDGAQPLSAHGVGSRQLMELHRVLEQWCGGRLPDEWMWESRSVDELVERVVRRLVVPNPQTTGS